MSPTAKVGLILSVFFNLVVLMSFVLVDPADAQTVTGTYRCQVRTSSRFNTYQTVWTKVGGGQCPTLITPTPVVTPSVTTTPTASASPSPTPSVSPSPSPTPTVVPSPSPSPSPTPTSSPVPTASPTPNPSGAFTVTGNTIKDPAGQRFIVKGVTPIYGPFAGGDYDGTWSTYSLTNSAAIFSTLKSSWGGVNTVRIFTSGAAANGNGPADWNKPNYRTALWPVIANARAQGFVVLIANSYSSIADTNSWITELAARYKDDPYVWITPSNEPFCTSPVATESSHCYDWTYWKQQTQIQVDLIRGQGNHNPILLDGLDWSWDWRGYPGISDPDSKIIFGAHRYACSDVCVGWTSTQVADANVKWANLAATMPIVVDEVGNWNNGGNNVGWYQGFTDFLATWVNTRGGAGAIAFNHYWSDANGQTTNGVTRNAWGNWWVDHFNLVAH